MWHVSGADQVTFSLLVTQTRVPDVGLATVAPSSVEGFGYSQSGHSRSFPDIGPLVGSRIESLRLAVLPRKHYSAPTLFRSGRCPTGRSGTVPSRNDHSQLQWSLHAANSEGALAGRATARLPLEPSDRVRISGPAWMVSRRRSLELAWPIAVLFDPAHDTSEGGTV
jgi:hypothetical protein